MESRIIVVDDETQFLQSIRRGLVTAGFRDIIVENSPVSAASLFRGGCSFDVALIDITMPEMDGLALLDIVRDTSPETECIMISAVDEARTAVHAMRKGAYDYLVKPVERDDLLLTLNRVLEKKRMARILDIGKGGTLPAMANPQAFRGIITASPVMLKILREAELHGASDVPILITGESGTGKELLARAIHMASPRKEEVFTPVNMASLSSSLFDAEFFGHARGAFTGAHKERAGYLEYSSCGTVFLDEIGSLPGDLQGKLLRVLQEGEYMKVGTDVPRQTGARFIAATNEELKKSVASGAFRKDLYYRLKGGWLHLPPLRERMEDLPLLVNHFIQAFTEGSGSIRKGAMERLSAYDYPGNIRELKSIVGSAVNLSPGGVVSVEALPDHIRKVRTPPKKAKKPVSGEIASLADLEKEHILRVYRQLGHNKSRTSRALNIALNTLRNKLRSYGVD